MIKYKPQKTFDVIIIGAGLSGLICASLLKKQNLKVALVESQNLAGHSHHQVQIGNGNYVDNTLRWIGGQPSYLELLELFNNALDLNLEFTKKPSIPVTYDNGKIKSFHGFGKTTPSFYDQISSFFNSEEIEINKKWYEIVDQLIKFLDLDLYKQHLVSEIIFNDSSAAQGVLINGQHYWQASDVIFSGQPADFVSLMPESKLTPRMRQHFKRPKLWTLVCVDFFHPQIISNSLELHVLDGTTNDEFGPCLGRFEAAASKDLQVSQWMTLIPDEDADDNEIIAHAIKKIKKQIKRAYPETFNAHTTERIVVIPSGAGRLQDSQLKSSGQIKGLDHLWLSGAALSDKAGVLRPIDQALSVVNALIEHKSKLTESNPQTL